PVFAGNDRPGIMLASAVESYLHRYAVLPGRRVVLFVDNDNAYPLAVALAAAGAAVAAIVDPRSEPGEAARQVVAGMRLYRARGVVATSGGAGGVRRARLAPLAGGSGTAIDCDLLVVSSGWNPNLQLFAQAQGRLRFDEELAAFVPDGIDAAVEAV